VAAPCDIVQEYMVPAGVTAVRIEAESSGSGTHSSSSVTLRFSPVQRSVCRLACLPARDSQQPDN
jgi:hypothetical protein